MKLLKRVLSILCAILLVTDICLASCLNVYAREYYRADDVIVEESQSEAMLRKAEEMTPASEAAPAQQLETPAADTVQTEAATEVKTTEVAKETVLSETQDSAEPETDGKQNSSESQDENIKETKETEETKETKETESKEPEEEFVPTMEYEDNDVKVHVAAVTPNAIPKNATLKVVPIVERTPVKGMTAEEVAEINDINNQYKEVEKKLAEKSENEEYDIAGFLAYDITFVDKDGNKVEPKGEVKVSMDYKKAIIPAEAAKADVEATDVTVMHFEEDANGQVKEIVDMVADESKEATIHTTENAEVQKTEFVTDSFSVYTVAWLDNNNGVSLMAISGDETVAVGDLITLTSGGLTNHKWESSDPSVATVIGNETIATVTGVSPGQVTVTHTYGTGFLKRTETFTVKVTASPGAPLKNKMVFKNIQNIDDDASIGHGGSLEGAEYNVMKFSIVLLNTDGSISYDLPEGSHVPATTIVEAKEVAMTDLIAQMGLSIPGYTLKDGWAFFWWYGNYDGPMYKVPVIRNFGGKSNKYYNQYESYLGFQGLYGEVAGDGTEAGYDDYINATFAETSDGTDYASYPNKEGYYAYNPTGTLRIVFFQVTGETKYQSRFVDAFTGNSSSVHWTEIYASDMEMHRIENWDQSQEKYEWYGTLKEVPGQDVPIPEDAHPGYVFKGWYAEKDEFGNGTGTKITGPDSDKKHYTEDAYYYAKWEPDDSGADKTFIKVSKTFTGISNIEEISDNFKIILYDAQNTPAAELKLSQSENAQNIQVSNEGLTYTWEISDLDGREYHITEENYEPKAGSDYEFDSKEIQTISADMTFSGEQVVSPSDDSSSFNIGNSNYICGLTGCDTFFIWTEDNLSVGERQAIVAHIKGLAGNFDRITEAKTDFYSTADIATQGIQYNGVVKVQNGQLTLSNPKLWGAVAYGTYTNGPEDTEIQVVNKYKESSPSIKILKTSNGGRILPGAEFKLYTDEQLTTEFESGQTYISDTNGLVFDKKLPTGKYYLREIKAPEGYSCLENTVEIQVTETGVTASGSEKVTYSNDGKVCTITVKNDMLYELPSAGGSGIFWYMISGVLLMMACALILYKNIREEVLRR